MKMTESDSIQGLCEWCGVPLKKSSTTMKVADDCICPLCYWEYRKDQHRIKILQKVGENNG